MNDKIIKIDDVEGKVYELDNWKPEQATQVKNHFTERFKELKEAYDELITGTPILSKCLITAFI